MNQALRALAVVGAAALVGLLLGASASRLKSYAENPYLAAVVTSAGVPTYNSRLVHKFGENPAPTADEDIWDCVSLVGVPGEYPWWDATGAGFTLYASSDNSADAGVTLVIEGIDSDWDRQTATHTLGDTSLDAVTADEAWFRIYRAYNTSSTDLTGNVYLNPDNTDATSDGIPDDVSQLQACILPGNNQTMMATYTTADDEMTWITKFCATAIDITGGAAGSAHLHGMARPASTMGAFRVQTGFGLDAGGSSYQCTTFVPPMYFPPRWDLKYHLEEASVDIVSGNYDMFIAQD